ncbi:MAG TPA: hypothetical protein VGQ13_01275 [Nitrososphaera sp.]|nr:hypothetical protein [Nitrososphaera sp.]
MGAPFDGKIHENVVYRLKKAPQSPVKYQYLIVSDNVGEPADILTINDFHSVKEKLKKRVKKGTGIEVTIALARKMDAPRVGRWFDDIKELHSFCQSSSRQFILSSGATSMHEMVSGPCLDAILKNCDINPHRHWREMNSWLEARLSRKVFV